MNHFVRTTASAEEAGRSGRRGGGLAKQVAAVNRRVLQRYGSTGALLALTTAIAMRPPRVVFPVADMLVGVGV